MSKITEFLKKLKHFGTAIKDPVGLKPLNPVKPVTPKDPIPVPKDPTLKDK